jgi:ElaB/YqjD/DUF883 family membrane-anchored ribosome-binding protein
MDPQPDVIREQIEETRSSLTDKLETLEAEVKETYVSAKESVEETIHNVKETVHNATETVKRTFDVRYQVDRHPWGMLGLSLVGGLLLGGFLGRRMRGGRRRATASPAAAWSQVTHDEPRQPGFVDRLGRSLGGELEKIQDSAINTLSNLIADIGRKAIPSLGAALEEMVGRAVHHHDEPQQSNEMPRETASRAGYQTPPMY